MKSQHIAMWSCSRSRSTVTTRAFEQLDGCILFDSPFYAPYLLATNLELPERKEVLKNLETDYKKVIEKITGSLPDGKLFSFQRHLAKYTLPEFGRDWLKSLNNFFLIRHPKYIISSYQKAQSRYGSQNKITNEDINLKALFHIFKEVESLSGNVPLVIDADDLIKNPRNVLTFLCNYMGIEFSDKMLNWEKPGLKDSVLEGSSLPSASKIWSQTWYTTVNNSQGFLPYEQKEVELFDELIPILEESMPYYNKLFEHRHIF